MNHLEKLIDPKVYRSPSEHKQLLSWVADFILGPGKKSVYDPSRGFLFNEDGMMVAECTNLLWSSPRPNPFPFTESRFLEASCHLHNEAEAIRQEMYAGKYYTLHNCGNRYNVRIKSYSTVINRNGYSEISVMLVGEQINQ